MTRPSDHLLRTLAPVPPSCNILEVGCGKGRHTESLLRLGFPVHACAADAESVAATRDRITDLVGPDTAATCVQHVPPGGFGTYPDDAFHWIVAHTPSGYVDVPEHLPGWLGSMRRLFIPGGWLYLAVGTPDPAANGTSRPALRPDEMTAHALRSGLKTAEDAAQTDEEGGPLVRGIFRLAPDVTSP